MEIEYIGYRFKASDVINIDDWIPKGEFNPHRIIPHLLISPYGIIGIVFASHLQDALDIAVDENRMDGLMYSPEDIEKMSEDELSDVAYLGNASEPFDLTDVDCIELPNPKRDWTENFYCQFIREGKE